ncbi:unnamed protein product, partial [Closterium sp. Naga37s-1]
MCGCFYPSSPPSLSRSTYPALSLFFPAPPIRLIHPIPPTHPTLPTRASPPGPRASTIACQRDALESSGAVRPVRFYLSPSRNALHCTWCFSQVMVGHPQVVHGGATAFAFDETFGVLFAMLGVGHGFTANISVNYRKPLPAAFTACMHVALDRVEGRK